jgi:hypothetical protein
MPMPAAKSTLRLTKYKRAEEHSAIHLIGILQTVLGMNVIRKSKNQKQQTQYG